MRNKIEITLLIILCVSIIGCWKPPKYNGIAQIQTNEIAFLVDMMGDESVAAKQVSIQKKDVLIPPYWVKTGRWEHIGYWRPSVKVLVVSQAPARLDWNGKEGTKVISMTSIESSGFDVPMSINAYIADQVDAENYLKSFRPVASTTTDWEHTSINAWGNLVREEAQPLQEALNSVVFTKFLEQLSQLFVKTPILYAEVSSKIYITAVYEGMSADALTKLVAEAGITAKDGKPLIFTKEVKSIKEWAKSEYGITITAVAPGDGVIYDNKDIQTQIDLLAAGVMKEKAIAQDKINAQAQQEVKLIEAETEKKVAVAKGATAEELKKLQEIENMKIIAEATAASIKSGTNIPVGTFPKGLQTLIITPNYNAFQGSANGMETPSIK